MLEDVLDDIGFGGLWRSSTFHTTHEHDRLCNALTDRLIEVYIEIFYVEFVIRANANLIACSSLLRKLVPGEGGFAGLV